MTLKTCAACDCELDADPIEVKLGGSTASAPIVDKPTPAPTPKWDPRIGPIALAGAGAITTIVGLGFGVAAISRRKDACGDNHYCEPSKLEDARSAARTSDIVTGLGLAAVAGVDNKTPLSSVVGHPDP